MSLIQHRRCLLKEGTPLFSVASSSVLQLALRKLFEPPGGPPDPGSSSGPQGHVPNPTLLRCEVGPLVGCYAHEIPCLGTMWLRPCEQVKLCLEYLFTKLSQDGRSPMWLTHHQVFCCLLKNNGDPVLFSVAGRLDIQR